MNTPTAGMAAGMAAGFAGFFGGFWAFLLVVALGALGLLVGAAVDGRVDLGALFRDREHR
ncbi:hypothetical protein [Streptomyces sp. NPDC059753]|uniref:hypothetical protein n=1 Tax=Streptomyces sp. NPDC059753 TaxID=3346933 RepID=UPI003647904E